MLTKILILAFALTTINCQEHYKTVLQHEIPQEYLHHLEQMQAKQQHEPAPIHEYQSGEVQGHQHQQQQSPGLSSQSIIHYQTAHQPVQESSEEHNAPVYQYVQAHQEEPSHHAFPVRHKIQALHIAKPSSGDEAEYHHHQEPLSHHHGHQIQYHVPSHHVSAPHQESSHRLPSSHHVPTSHYEPAHHEPSHHKAESHSHESHEEPIDYYAYPKYQYEYKVEDPHTGDNKYQHEMRDGDTVKGVYSLHEADGSVRTVEYSSDKHNGFSAIVKHSAPGQHVEIRSHHKN